MISGARKDWRVFLRLLVGMSRRLRFIPDHGALVEVTCRALHSRFLFRPGPMLNAIILGALARAKSLYSVRICAFAFVSNHFHLILEVDDALQLARFMNHFNSKLAREVGRLTGWREKIFGRRYQAITISSEDQAQTERLKYVLSHGCKENLVARLQEWPGVHCVQALMEEKTLEGWWFNRTQEYLARRRGEDFGPFQYATRETLELDPLPCWKHLTPEQRQKRVAALVPEIEGEAVARRERTGVQPLGPTAILATVSPPRSRGPPPRLSMPRRGPSAASCETPTSGSSPPIGTPPRNFGQGIATSRSPRVASLLLCLSWEVRQRAAGATLRLLDSLRRMAWQLSKSPTRPVQSHVSIEISHSAAPPRSIALWPFAIRIEHLLQLRPPNVNWADAALRP